MLLPNYAKLEGKSSKCEYRQLYGSYVYSAFRSAYFGRIDGDKHFRCAMTQVAPGLKSSWPLHPSVREFKILILPVLILNYTCENKQKRIITVRECARAQGFPDCYVFKSINTDPSKIVQDVGIICRFVIMMQLTLK